MGRPKSFQPDEVLDRAIHVFWEKGYEGASVDDLTKAMGINRFSMYSTFGDKHALFIKALEKYERVWRSESLPTIAGARSFDELIEHFYASIDAVLADDTHSCGCVMVLTAVTQAAHDEASKALVVEHQKAFVEALEGALKTIEGDGGLRSPDDGGMTTTEAARFFAVMNLGMVVAGASGQTRAMLRRTVRHAVDALRS